MRRLVWTPKEHVGRMHKGEISEVDEVRHRTIAASTGQLSENSGGCFFGFVETHVP